MTNAGTVAVRGTYVEYDTYDGVACFKHSSAEYYLYRGDDGFGTKSWAIDGTLGTNFDMALYYDDNLTESDTPVSPLTPMMGDAPGAIVTEI